MDKLYDILKDYPQVVFFTSHTHWDLNLPDWAGKKKIKGGDEKGFTVVNTGGLKQAGCQQDQMEERKLLQMAIHLNKGYK